MPGAGGRAALFLSGLLPNASPSEFELGIAPLQLTNGSQCNHGVRRLPRYELHKDSDTENWITARSLFEPFGSIESGQFVTPSVTWNMSQRAFFNRLSLTSL